MTEFSPNWDGCIADADTLLRRLFPICRSITGNGVRQTLAILREQVDFAINEVPSGTVCYDWTIPDEWNVREAYIADIAGHRLVDFQINNLHLVNYSIPHDEVMSFTQLKHHLHSLPDLPDAIPYRTSYYDRTWGFCLTHKQLQTFDPHQQYHVYIDTTLAPGSLTYGEGILPGTSGQEYLISTYCCHPSLGNDNLSGIVLWTLLLKELSRYTLRHSYNFVIVPETIGAITYLSRNETRARAFIGGFIPSTVAGPGKFGYKRTFQGNPSIPQQGGGGFTPWSNHSVIDRVVYATFRELKLEFIDYPFDINGSDERQYSSPYFRIPIGTICKDKYYEYTAYHTSLDNLDFISADSLVQTLKLYLLAIEKLEQNKTYCSKLPYGEPMLGKRGLYPKIGGSIKQTAADLYTHHADRTYVIQGHEELSDPSQDILFQNGNILYGNELDAMRWVLFYSDGQTSLLDIADQTNLPMRQLSKVAEKLVQHGLLEVVKLS